MTTSTTPDTGVAPVLAPPLTPDAARDLPFRAGTPEQFRELRERLRAAGYTYEEIYRRGRRRRDLAAGEGRAADAERALRVDAVEALMLLYFDAYALPWSTLRNVVEAPLVDLLDGLGLLLRLPGCDDLVVASVLLYPIGSVYIASDHPRIVGPERNGKQADFVFAAMSSNTQQYMTFLPDSPCDAFAEMCGGTGVAAIEAARFARHSWTLDITERSTRFAEFNARLNGAENVTAVQGDLYDPVRGMTFDRIVAHPPYVPAFQQELIFRDGGADGEQITRRIVQGLPDHLRPGGRFYCVCQATDREDAPLQQRLRAMLGAAHEEFDVLVIELVKPTNPTEYYARLAWSKDGAGFAEVETRHKAFREMGVTHLVYSLIVLQRREGERPVFTVRREAASTRSPQVEWMLDWETFCASAPAAAALLDRRVAVQPWVGVDVRLRVQDGRFEAVGTGVRSELPARFDADCPSWMAAFLTKCDGRTTVRERLAALRAEGLVPAELPDERFGGLVAELVGAGVVAVDGIPSPPPFEPPLWARPDPDA